MANKLLRANAGNKAGQGRNSVAKRLKIQNLDGGMEAKIIDNFQKKLSHESYGLSSRGLASVGSR